MCILYRNGELVHEKEGEVVRHAGNIEVFGEYEYRQDDHGGAYFPFGQFVWPGCRSRRTVRCGREFSLVPVADAFQQQNGEQSGEGEPADGGLPEGNDDECGQQRSHGAPRIAADLKDGLGQPFPPARGELGDARRFGMEDRRTPTDKRDGEQDGEKAVCRCEREQSGEGEAHPHSQRVGSRVQVGVTSHEGLQERGGHLKHQRDDAYLGESEAEIIFEERVDSRYYRLHHVVEQVCGADHEEYRVHGSAPCRCTCRSGKMSGCGIHGITVPPE